MTLYMGDRGNIHIKWDDVRRELFSPEEIAESDLRVALIGELVKDRKEKGNGDWDDEDVADWLVTEYE